MYVDSTELNINEDQNYNNKWKPLTLEHTSVFPDSLDHFEKGHMWIVGSVVLKKIVKYFIE